MRRSIALALAASILLAAPAAVFAQERTELVVSCPAGGIGFDPHAAITATEAQIFTAIYEGLFTYDPATLEPIKAAAGAFSRSPDGKVYTFTIASDAAWSNGDRLTAAHFRDAWLRMLEPEREADYAAFFDVIEGAREFRTGKLKDKAKVGVVAKSDAVLEVRLENPAAYFTRLLCHHSFSPVHPSMLALDDWEGVAAAGKLPVNGPFAVASYSADELRVVRNPRYRDAAAVRLDAIRFPFIDEDAEVSRLYNNGEIHWATGNFDYDSLLAKEDVQAHPMFATHYWFFRSDRGPWAKADVRRALALLLPWDEIRDEELYGIVAETLVLPFEGYEAPEGIVEADLDEAMALLEKAGFPEGKRLPAIRFMIPDGEDARRIAALMGDTWKELLALEYEVAVVPPSRFFEKVKSEDYDISLTSWIGDFADPLAFLQMWVSDSNLNDARWKEAGYDELIAKSNAQDGAKRAATLAEAEALLLGGAAVMPIYHSLAINLVNPEAVDGWFDNVLDIHPFKAMGFGSWQPMPGVASGGAFAGTGAELAFR
ncbi:MAG: peptide ABC transporter substrate-binding protein [Spirochaetales bacterium]|nr:peptide ABC transporter substrate-binding protein [Spirochaetales bacterium]